MSMAHLIKKIAMDSSRSNDLCIISNSHNSTFKCCTQDTDSLPPTRHTLSVIKSVFSREQPSPELQILKTEEFRVHSGPMKDLEQPSMQRVEPEIYDGSSFISNNDSVAWADVDWRSNSEEEQSASISRDLQAHASNNDEAHLMEPAPALLRPS